MIFAVFGPFPLGLWINCSFFSVLSFSCRHASFEVYYIGWYSAFVDDITHIHRNRRSFIYCSSDGKTVLLHRDRGCAKSQVKGHSSLARFFSKTGLNVKVNGHDDVMNVDITDDGRRNLTRHRKTAYWCVLRLHSDGVRHREMTSTITYFLRELSCMLIHVFFVLLAHLGFLGY